MRREASDVVAGIDLVELATDLLGPPKGTGRSAKWPSPVAGHAQTGATPPMGIFVGADGKQRWKCFSTGESGDAIDLLMAVDQVSFGQAYALATLRASGAAVDREPPTWQPVERPAVRREVVEEFVTTASTMLEEPGDMPGWLVDHGIEWSWLKHHGIGWVEGEVPGMKYPVDGAVVMPVRAIDGRLVGADLRVLHGSAKYLCVKGEGWDGLNYVRPAMRRRNDVIAVAEGSIDAIGFAEATGVATVGIESTGVAAAAVEQLIDVAGCRAVAIAVDDDKAGNLAAARFLTAIPNSFRIGLNGGDVGDALHGGKDLASFVDGGIKTLDQQVEVAL